MEWFDLGGSLQLADSTSAEQLLERTREVQGLTELAQAAGIPAEAPAPLLASGVDFVLEGLFAMKKISRGDERGYHATEKPVRRPAREATFPDDMPMPAGEGKKKYYN